MAAEDRPGRPADRTGSASNLLSLARDPGLWRGPGPWIVALLIAANLWVAHNFGELVTRRQDTLKAAGVGDGSHAPGAGGRVRLYADRGSSVPRFDESSGEATWTYWDEIPDARLNRLVVLTGMSQNLAINDYRPGQLTIPEQLDDLVRPSGARAFGLAAPNFTNEELELLTLALLTSPRTRPMVLVFGACFDKFRNVDLRPGYRQFLRRTPALREAWTQTIDAYAARYPLATAKMRATLDALHEGQERKEETSLEDRLREKVAGISPLVAARTDLNVILQLEAFAARNVLLNIKSTSKRPILAARYDLNREFLAMVADEARLAGTTLAIYVVPLQPGTENPYIPAEYAQFKGWIERFAADRGIPFANLEDLVPQQHWGQFAGGPDFKHFRVEGHRLTAEAIVRTFRSLWAPPRAGGTQ
jgi:hypothetical protein